MRYIDADALYEKLYPLDLVDKRLYTINAKAVADAIANTPTADVVPKSEVEKLKIAYEGSQKAIKGLTEMIREKDKELAKLETHLELHYGEKSLNNLIAKEKAEVAREIFEDIERLTKETMRADEKCMDDNLILEWRLCCHKDFLYWLAELKKKYIGGTE